MLIAQLQESKVNTLEGSYSSSTRASFAQNDFKTQDEHIKQNPSLFTVSFSPVQYKSKSNPVQPAAQDKEGEQLNFRNKE